MPDSPARRNRFAVTTLRNADVKSAAGLLGCRNRLHDGAPLRFVYDTASGGAAAELGWALSGAMVGAAAPREVAEGFAVDVADGFGFWAGGEVTGVPCQRPGQLHRRNLAAGRRRTARPAAVVLPQR